jgi:hypothetical protein
MKRAKFRHVHFPVFSYYCVHVEITPDIEKSLSKYPETRGICPDHTSHADGVTVHVDDHGKDFIFLNPDCTPGVIAHEAWHSISRMLSYVGVDLDSETVAYHLGYLVDEIFKFAYK